MSEHNFTVPVFVRLKNFLIRFIWMSLLFSLIYLMFLTEADNIKHIYIIVTGLVTLFFSIKNAMKGTSFIIKKDSLEILKGKEYPFNKYRFETSRSKFNYIVIVFKNKEINIYDEEKRLVDSVDCNAMSEKQFSKLTWILRDKNIV